MAAAGAIPGSNRDKPGSKRTLARNVSLPVNDLKTSAAAALKVLCPEVNSAKGGEGWPPIRWLITAGIGIGNSCHSIGGDPQLIGAVLATFLQQCLGHQMTDTNGSCWIEAGVESIQTQFLNQLIKLSLSIGK